MEASQIALTYYYIKEFMIKLCDTLLTKMVIGNTVILLYETAEPEKNKKIGKICDLNTLFITRFRL